jgi:hypothetical protein
VSGRAAELAAHDPDDLPHVFQRHLLIDFEVDVDSSIVDRDDLSRALQIGSRSFHCD